MLTLNESAQVVADILRDIQEKAPTSIDICRAVGADAYMAEACAELNISDDDLYDQHKTWLKANLSDDRSLNTLERTPAILRQVGTDTLIKAGMERLPWYD